MGEIVKLFPDKIAHPKPDGERMDSRAFRIDIIRPALKLVGLFSESAENLLLGTALAESGLNVVKQIGGGPALSFFQLEDETITDCIRYLNRQDKRRLKARILSACYLEIFPQNESVTWNLRYATLLARVKYWMQPSPLPSPNDAIAHGEYWKKFFNSEDGKGTVEHFVSQWGYYGVGK